MQFIAILSREISSLIPFNYSSRYFHDISSFRKLFICALCFHLIHRVTFQNSSKREHGKVLVEYPSRKIIVIISTLFPTNKWNRFFPAEVSPSLLFSALLCEDLERSLRTTKVANVLTPREDFFHGGKTFSLHPLFTNRILWFPFLFLLSSAAMVLPTNREIS